MHIQANQKEFGAWYSQMQWADGAYLKILTKQRNELLRQLQNQGIGFGYNATKFDTRNVSPGCRHCAEGQWSCLFINNKCNASCFYCPSSQNDISEPSTQSFVFSEVDDYIAYLERFGFKGASLSGGEPFLSFDKTLSFVKAIKKHFGKNMHLWLYTNGILADEKKIGLLTDAGLDEIRFDIGATAYITDKVALAVGRIPTVTVEIPAVDLEKLKIITLELSNLGVNHLNLHQLRATPYNVEKIIKKGFCFIHGAKVLVAESEIIALECMKYTLENKISLPVNYCSFVFKNSHQNKAARLRAYKELIKPYESITQAGFIRTFSVRAEASALQILHQELLTESQLSQKGVVAYLESAGQLYFSLPLLAYVFSKGFEVFLSYSYVHLRSSLSYQNPFKEIRLANKRVFVEKITVMRNQKMDETICMLLQNINNLHEEPSFLLQQIGKEEISQDDEYIVKLIRIKEFEFMKQGLQEYY